MDLLTHIFKIPLLTKLVTHLRIPLYRNGYALVLSSAVTSVLGLLYWVVAARSYTTEAVGLNSAAMSAMLFLANLSALNLNNALNRFIPTAGRATGRLVRSSYLISLGTALVASLIFILGLGLWAPTLGFLKSSFFFVLWFALATMAWCIFLLQDSVFTGLRQATWVPIENAIFAVAKIALLILFAKPFVQFGVLASWTIPLAAVILPVNIFIYRRLIPEHVRATAQHAEPIVPAQIARYVAGNYLGSLIWIATISLLPIIVTERIGATANAYFYLSWTIAYSFYLVSRNMGMSLITEGAANQAKLDILSYRTFIQTGRLLLPAVAVVVLLAPYLLRLFGESYAAEGVRLLRLLCFSALPYLVTSTYLSIARVQRRIAALIVVQTSLAVLIFALSIVLMDIFGITGIGIAWLASQSAVAAVLLITGLGKAWLPYLNVQIPLRLLSAPRRALWRWRKRIYLRRASELIPEILDGISPTACAPPPSDWKVLQMLPTVSDMAVISVGTEKYGAQALLKLPQTNSAATSMRQQTAVLTRLQSDPRLNDWRSLLPTLLAADQTGKHPYTMEQMMPGIEARALLADPERRIRLQRAATAAIGELHRLTGASVAVDSERFGRWVDKPLALLREAVSAATNNSSTEEVVDRLRTELHGALAGRSLSAGWVHGDFVPGNILVTPDGASVSGIVDWDLASPDDIPQLDLTWFFLATRMAVEKRELGDVLRDMLERAEWTPEEQQLLDAAQGKLTGDGLDSRTVLLLCWLRHVTGTIYKSDRYARHRLWVAKNVVGVLRSI